MQRIAVVAFGRFNSPTLGHLKLIEAVETAAKRHRGTPMIFASQTTEPKKNPLHYEEKIGFMRKLFPAHAKIIQLDKKIKTPINILEQLNTKFDVILFVAGSDRVPEYQKLFTKYNGDLYDYTEIEVISAGERDPDAEGVSGFSASAARKYVAMDDMINFNKMLPNNASIDLKQQLFLTMRMRMGLLKK